MAGPPMNAVYSSLFAVAAGSEVTTLFVAFPVSAAATCAGVAPGFDSRYSAAAPDTCAAAMDVPLTMLVVTALPGVKPSPVFEPVPLIGAKEIHADLMFTPGAIKSTQLPELEKPAKTSVLSDAATVMAFGALDGDELHASDAEFPAATTTVIPAAMAFCTA